MSTYSIFWIIMLYSNLLATNSQKVLGLLAKFSDQEFYERQVARKLGISYGSANRALNELYKTGAVLRRGQGKMYFYSINPSNPAIADFKKIINIMLIEPIVEKLKHLSNRIVLYGSCAIGTDTSKSDLDLFVVSEDKDGVLETIHDFMFPKGYESIKIQAVIKTPVELLERRDTDREFLEEVDRGIILWEKAASESRV